LTGEFGHRVIWLSGHWIADWGLRIADCGLRIADCGLRIRDWYEICVWLAGMSVQSDQLKERTMRFAVDVLRLIDELPQKTSADVIGRQLAKSATSVASNYRATCNARSRAEFIAKLGVVVEEADESVGWLDMIGRAQLLNGEKLKAVSNEAVELRAIFARSVGTARQNVSK
jgi:four helix bundle protein